MRSRPTLRSPHPLALTLVAVPWLVAAAGACGPDASPPPVAAGAAAPPVASASASAWASPSPAASLATSDVDSGVATAGDSTDAGDPQYGDNGLPGHGRVVGSPWPTPPTLRQGATTVNGRLPPEVIQRIVRQNYGYFRLCYDAGLRKDAQLEGRIAVKLVIDGTGALQSAVDDGSALPDASVVACVVRAFDKLAFPEPEGGGIVTVVYRIIFAPPGPAKTSPATKPQRTPKKM